MTQWRWFTSKNPATCSRLCALIWSRPPPVASVYERARAAAAGLHMAARKLQYAWRSTRDGIASAVDWTSQRATDAARCPPLRRPLNAFANKNPELQQIEYDQFEAFRRNLLEKLREKRNAIIQAENAMGGGPPKPGGMPRQINPLALL